MKKIIKTISAILIFLISNSVFWIYSDVNKSGLNNSEQFKNIDFETLSVSTLLIKDPTERIKTIKTIMLNFKTVDEIKYRIKYIRSVIFLRVQAEKWIIILWKMKKDNELLKWLLVSGKSKKNEKVKGGKKYKTKSGIKSETKNSSVSNTSKVKIEKITVDGKERTFAVYTPDNLSENASVLFYFHWTMRTRGGVIPPTVFSAKMSDSYSLNKLARENNIVIIHPLGLMSLERLWWKPLPSEDQTNAKFFDEILNYVKANIPKVSPNKVYVSGHSSGAIYSFFLAGERANKIAAAVSVSGQRSLRKGLPEYTKDGTSIPFRAYNGVNDRSVNFDAAVKNIKVWHTEENKGTLNNPEVSTINIGNYEVKTTKYKGGFSDLEFYAVQNVGHGIDWNIIGNSLWDFMKSHVKNN